MENTRPLPDVGHRYILYDELGRGGMGVVYRALDRLTGGHVALKMVSPPRDDVNFASTSSAELRLALAREFKLLASMRHPHIISVLDYGFAADGMPYYTMELVENSMTILDAGRGKSVEERLSLLVQVLHALTYLHRYGVLHRDLKPENVLTTQDQIKLMDFGLSVLRDQSQDAEAAGTLAYIAPEILQGKPPSAASDLYAVGVIAFELMAGRHPFEVGNTTRLIQDVLNASPDLSVLDVEKALLEVLGRLLAKTAEDRYHEATQVIAALNAAARTNFPEETQATRESLLRAAPFVGREHEIQSLLAELDKALNGQGSAWLIGGESGVGKSRLLDELRTHALVRGALVLRGQDISENGNPYQVWRDAIRRLVLLGELSPLQAGLLRPLVPDIALLLNCEALDAPALDAGAAQDRLFGVIEELFRASSTPIILMLEDLHWTDSASLLLLLRLSFLALQRPLLIMGTYRNDERPSLPTNLPGMRIMKLERMDEQGIEALAAHILGDAARNPRVIELLKTESDGNVFFLVEAVRALADLSGQLTKIGTEELPAYVFTDAVRDLVQRRLNRVPEGEQPLLRLAATSGRELDIHVLQAAAPDTNIELWLATCAGAAVLEISEERWRFAHDKLRQGLLSQLDPEEVRDLHRQVAEAVEQVYPDGEGHLATLAQHWELAEDYVRSAEWYARAGQHAEAAFAPEDAIEYYQKALIYLPDAPEYTPLRLDIYNGLGKMLRWQARFDEAVEIWTLMLHDAEQIGDLVAEARALIGLGDALDRKGERAKALDNAERAEQVALQAGEQAIPELIEAQGNRAWGLYRLGKLDDAAEVARSALDLSVSINLRSAMARNQNTLAITHFLSGRREEAYAFMKQALEIVRELGDKRDEGIKLNNLGDFARLSEDHQLAAEYYEQAAPIFKAVGYREGELVVLHNLAAMRLALDKYEEAENKFREVIALVANEDWWGLPEAYRLLAEACLMQEKLPAALEAARSSLQTGLRMELNAEAAMAWRMVGRVASIANIEKAITLGKRLYSPRLCFEQSLKLLRDGAKADEREIALTLQAWGDFEIEHGDPEKGRAMWEEAEQIFQRLEV